MGPLSAASRVDQSDQSFEPLAGRRRGGPGPRGTHTSNPRGGLESRLGHGTLFPNKFLLWETAVSSMPFMHMCMHMSWDPPTLPHTHIHTHTLTQCYCANGVAFTLSYHISSYQTVLGFQHHVSLQIANSKTKIYFI